MECQALPLAADHHGGEDAGKDVADQRELRDYVSDGLPPRHYIGWARGLVLTLLAVLLLESTFGCVP